MRYHAYIIDLVALTFTFLFSIFFAFQFVDFSTHPIEDAAMLMRYSEHFANGDGIVWNIGEEPVDGATDFLFMVAVGFLVKAGLSLEFATRFLGFSSHLLTVGLVYFSLRKLFNAPLLVAVGTGVLVTVGPGFYYVVAYFGTTFFALSACVSWLFALLIIKNGEEQRIAFLFALSSLVTGLVRPEGVFLTAFMLMAIILIKGLGNSRHTINYYFGIFLLLGGTYLLWRWQYFGYPLPNPYYKKGGGEIYLNSLNISYINSVFLCLPLIPAFIAGFPFVKTLRKTFGFLIPILGFATLFILLVNDMNIRARFQYVVLPLASMVWWSLTEGVRDRLNISDVSRLGLPQRMFYFALTMMFFVGTIKLEYDIWHVQYYYDGKYAVAVMLSEYQDSELRIATSEAGLLPLYSELKSLDTWGLNDKWIAHNGGISDEYLEGFDPHIIMFHAYFSPIASSGKNDAWDVMTVKLRNYAEKNGYILAASFGENPYDTEYYYVRPDFPESAEIVQRIREVEYYSGITGARFINYAPGSDQ